MKKSDGGIYAIVHIETGRRYIGSAVSISSRWSKHKSDLRSGSHCNRKLRGSWAKHGENAFRFEVVELVTDRTKLIEREQFWMDTLNPYYNLVMVAGSCLGMKMSAEARAKISAANKGQYRMPAESHQRRIEKITGLKQTAETCDKRRAKMLGRTFSDESISKMRDATANRSQDHLDKIGESNAGEYIVTAPDGTEISVRNLSKFCRENDLLQNKMSNVATGSRKHHKGWLCRHDDAHLGAAVM